MRAARTGAAAIGTAGQGAPSRGDPAAVSARAGQSGTAEGDRIALRLVKLTISLVVAAGDWSAAALRGLAGRPAASTCVVLYYHAVTFAARDRFARQMDMLRRICLPVDPEQAGALPNRRRCAAVTFDDAFMSVVENALPVLEARGIPCTIFVPTGSLGGRPSWIEATHADGMETVASAEVVAGLVDRPLVGIGSHSVSHPDFRRLGEAEAVEELATSKAMLERLIGREVLSFSFPHGAYGPRTLILARQCGYARMFTVAPQRLSGSLQQDVVGRVRVDPGDWSIEFRLKAVGAYRWMVWASAFKRHLLSRMRGQRRQVQSARVA